MHTMSSTEQNKQAEGGISMNEKIYTAMRNTGVLNIVLGIVALLTGIVGGVLMIVSGANLLKKKRGILM